MKNKRLVIFVALLLAFTIVILCSCSGTDAKLNKLVKKSYDYVRLTITTDNEGIVLNSVYTATKADDGNVRVSYSYQTLNIIDMNGTSIMLPEGRITTYRGTAVINVKRNNATVTSSGDELNLNLKQITANNLKFKSKNFSDIQEENGYFYAKINDFSQFLGTTIIGSDASVSVMYSNDALISLIITYINESGSVITASYQYQPEN